MAPIHELSQHRASIPCYDTNKTPGHTTIHPERTATMSGVLGACGVTLKREVADLETGISDMACAAEDEGPLRFTSPSPGEGFLAPIEEGCRFPAR